MQTDISLMNYDFKTDINSDGKKLIVNKAEVLSYDLMNLKNQLPNKATPKPLFLSKSIMCSIVKEELSVEFQYCIGHEPEYLLNAKKKFFAGFLFFC